MQKDRSHWIVRKVSMAEADELDNEYYAGLSEVERLEILMELRSVLGSESTKIAPVVFKKHIRHADGI